MAMHGIVQSLIRILIEMKRRILVMCMHKGELGIVV